MNSANLRMEPYPNMKPPSRKRIRLLVRLLKWVALPLAVLLLTLGFLTLPLPLPTGIILIVCGLALAAFHPGMRRWIRRTRGRFPKANSKIRLITPRLPGVIRRALQRTDSPNQ